MKGKVSLAKKNLHAVDRESLVEKITITKLKSHHTIKTSQSPVVDGAEVEAGIAPSQSQIDEVELGAGAVIMIEPGQANVAEVEAEKEIQPGEEVAVGAKIVKSQGPVNVAEVENDLETVGNPIKKMINHEPADEVEAGAKIV